MISNPRGKASCPPSYTANAPGAVCPPGLQPSIMNLSAVLPHISLLEHWLRCILSPSKYFVAGGLQPIQTITPKERELSVRGRRNSDEVAQQLLCAKHPQVLCLICCASGWWTSLSRTSQHLISSQKKEGGGEERHSDWEGNMRITPTSNSAWGDSKLLAANAFNDEHQDVQTWLREGKWKLAKIA